MKSIFLHIEYYKKGKVVHLEVFENATMDKNFVYFDKFKIKKVDTEKILPGDVSYEEGKIKRRIKLYTASKFQDSRIIPVEK